MFKSILENQIDSVARIAARNDAIDSRIEQVDVFRDPAESNAFYHLVNTARLHKPEEKIARLNLSIAKLGYVLYDFPFSHNKQEYAPLRDGLNNSEKGMLTGAISSAGVYALYAIQTNQGISQMFSQLWEKSNLPIFDVAIIGTAFASIPILAYVSIKSLIKGMPQIRNGYARFSQGINQQIEQKKKQYSRTDFPELSLI
jgi:hypothetical protein